MSTTSIAAGLLSAPRRPVSPAPRVWAGSVMLLSSLVLVGMGGCFLVGVLGLIHPELLTGRVPGDPPPSASLSGEARVLMFALYAPAFLCFVGAAILFIMGVCGLWRVLRAESAAFDG